MDDLKNQVDAIDNIPGEVRGTDHLRGADQERRCSASRSPPTPTRRRCVPSPKKSAMASSTRRTITQVELAGVRPYEISIEVSGGHPARATDSRSRRSPTRCEPPRSTSPAAPSAPRPARCSSAPKASATSAGGFDDITVVTRSDGTVVRAPRDRHRHRRLRGRRCHQPLRRPARRSSSTSSASATRTRSSRRRRRQGLPRTRRAEMLPEGVDGRDLERHLGDASRGRLDLLPRTQWHRGLILVFIVLALFLRPSLAFLVSIGIPVSFAGAIWMMPMVGHLDQHDLPLRLHPRARDRRR